MKIPQQLKKDLDNILKDPVSFIRLLKIQDKYSGKLVPFTPNDEQIGLIKKLQKHDKIIILKPRQIGISTILRAYALWKTYTTEDPLKYGVISFHQRSAKNLRRMDKTMHDSLPKALHRSLELDNATTMSFMDTKSELSSFTAGSKGGTRSFSLSSVHLSEFAFYDNPDEMLAQIMATVGTGQIIIESTPNQPGDTFHRLIQNAPENGWHLVTYWWWQHYKYTQQAPHDFQPNEEEEELITLYGVNNDQLYWRRQQIATLGLTKFRREYPACIEDAFFSTNTTYLPLDCLRKIKEVFFDSDERIYEKPRQDDIYAIGVDVGAGVGGDYSAITVVSMSTLQPVYHYRNNTLSPSQFADKVLQIGDWYNEAKVLCESNNHGHVVLYRLRHFGYKNLWLTPDGQDWNTNVKSKLDAFETLREYIVEEMIDSLDSQVLSELRNLTVMKVTPQAPYGMHDDLAMSMALAYRCVRDIPQRKLTLARRNLMDMLISEVRATKRKYQPIAWKVNE